MRIPVTTTQDIGEWEVSLSGHRRKNDPSKIAAPFEDKVARLPAWKKLTVEHIKVVKLKVKEAFNDKQYSSCNS